MSGREDRPAPERDGSEDEPFFSRWARLKKESRELPAGDAAGSEAPQAPLTADGRSADGAEQASPPTAAETAAAPADAPPLELPPLESLTAESDFRAFMQPGVDDALRRAALRKMWQNPIYGVVDELDPFRADFAAFTPLGDIVTADMKFHAERLLREQLEKAAEGVESAGVASEARATSGTGEAGEVPARETRDVAAATSAEAGGSHDTQDESNLSTEDADERRDT
jgi:hypothetical protein